jgi:DNA-binding phage protein
MTILAAAVGGIKASLKVIETTRGLATVASAAGVEETTLL